MPTLLWKTTTMLVSISVSSGFHTILSWVIIRVEESWSLICQSNCKTTIPYGQALHLQRICSKQDNLGKCCQELEHHLTKRGTRSSVKVHVHVPFSSSHPFVSPQTFREQPLLVLVGIKNCSRFHACDVSTMQPCNSGAMV